MLAGNFSRTIRLVRSSFGPRVLMRRSLYRQIASAIVLIAICSPSTSAVEPTTVGAAARNASPKHLEAVQAELRILQKQHAARLDAFAQDFTDLGHPWRHSHSGKSKMGKDLSSAAAARGSVDTAVRELIIT